MRRGPKGEKRHANLIVKADHVMRIAAGEIEDVTLVGRQERRVAVARGRQGACGWHVGQEAEREIAIKAAKAWGGAINTKPRVATGFW